MSNAESKQFETLAKAGFQDKTDDQKDKLSKGTQHGILCHIGPGAFKGGTWDNCDTIPKEGQTVIFDRYCGVEMELPPGSGNLYRYANDEALLGVMVGNDE